MINNWYNSYLNNFLFKLSSLNSEDLPYFNAQLLLKELSKNFPNNLKNKCYIAGGAVRDEILGNIPKDIDIVVEAFNGGIELAYHIARTLDLHDPIVFPNFGTAQLVLKETYYNGKLYKVDGIPLEFVQTRKEQYHEESRKPEVSFGTLKEDVERRDFTVNSLLKKLSSGPSINSEDALIKVETGDILDLTGKGLSDIKNGVIRTPLDPNIIFKEDALRIIRAVRFSVKYNWELNPEVISGIKSNIYRLNTISKERIRDELNKIIGYKKLHNAIPLMKELGLLKFCLPEMDNLIGVEQDKKWHSEGDAYIHSLKVIENIEKQNEDVSLELIWSALAHDWGKKDSKSLSENGNNIHFYGHEKISENLVEKRMRDLKYPLDVIKKVKKLVSVHMRGHQSKNWGQSAFRKYFRDLGDEYEDALKLLRADETASLSENGERSDNYGLIKNKVKEISKNPIPKKPILNGKDIIDFLRDYKPERINDSGPHIGLIMSLQNELILEHPEIFIDGNPELSKENMRKIISKDVRFNEILKSLGWKD